MNQTIRFKEELVALKEPQIIGTHVITPQNADGSGGLYGVDHTIKANRGNWKGPGTYKDAGSSHDCW